MSDLGGIGGALLLSDQISTDRLFDSFRQAREANNLAISDASWRNHYNELVNRYNRLLNDANKLADIQDKSLDAKDRQIAELNEINASLAAEVERLRLEVLSVRGELGLMHRFEEERTLREQEKGG